MAIAYQSGEIIHNKYRITDILGKGGVAITYSAIALETESQVAIKVISLKQLKNWKEIELFQREAAVLAKLDHPAIPKYIDYFTLETETDQAFYLVQQQAPGKSLAQLIANGWHTTEQEVKDIAQQILEILIYLHSLEPPVIHRDLKPNNLIRSDEGKIYVVDFGAVQNTYYNTLMQGSTVVGTYGYMAPEQFRGKALPATDLYSLGATILYLLTHRSPAELPQDTLKLDFRNYVDISESFADWLDKILEPDIEDRFTSTELALNQLFVKKNRNKKRLITSFAITILSLSVIWFVSSYKWWFLSRLGFYPANICSDVNIVKNYLNQGGKANIKSLDKKIEFADKEPIFNCVIKSKSIEEIHKQYVIKLLIKKGADIEVKNSKSETPLFIATQNKNKNIIQLLLDAGANVDAKNSKGETSLFIAAQHKNKNIIQLLLDAGADIDAQNLEGETILFKAIWEKDIAKLLIENGADLNLKTFKSGWTPLFKANDRDITRLLINAGADVNIQGRFNLTPLFMVAQRLDCDVVKILIDAGADVNHRNTEGQTPLFFAARAASNGSYANLNCNIEVFEKLIDAGANINAQDNKNETPLFNAAHFAHLDIVQLLIDQGADINAVSIDGTTPIFHTIREETTQLLINNGSDVNHRNFKGETPLFSAWHQDLVRVLIENGADVNAKDKDGRTLLTDAIVDMTQSDRSRENISLLINNGIDTSNISYEQIEKLYDLTERQYRKAKFLLERLDIQKSNK